MRSALHLGRIYNKIVTLYSMYHMYAHAILRGIELKNLVIIWCTLNDNYKKKFFCGFGKDKCLVILKYD